MDRGKSSTCIFIIISVFLFVLCNISHHLRIADDVVHRFREFTSDNPVSTDEPLFHCAVHEPDVNLIPINRPKVNTTRKLSQSYITSAEKTVAKIWNPRAKYNVCDTVGVSILARDRAGFDKPFGGDYFRLKLFTSKPYSAIGPDYFFDYDNGTYLALFTLRWSGKINIAAQLVHPSEAVQILGRTQNGSASKTFTFYGTFRALAADDSKVHEENVTCGVAPFKPPMCNKSSNATHGPWYCKKPKDQHLTCSHWEQVFMNTAESSEKLQKTLSATELSTFSSTKVKLNTTLLAPIIVNGTDLDPGTLPLCALRPVPSTIATRGYFLKDRWQPFSCRTKSFNTTRINSCLKGKAVHFYGDSTGKQMYEYLQERANCTIKNGHGGKWCVGDHTALHFKFHGPPIRGKSKQKVKDIRYVAQEIDDLQGGAGVVIVLSVWAHFGLPEGSFYSDRLLAIQGAVHRLWKRSPETRVIVRSANTREHSIGGFILISSDWIALQGEKTLRAVFSDDKRFSFLDVWDMTLVQQSKDNVHPLQPTLVQIMDYLLTMIC